MNDIEREVLILIGESTTNPDVFLDTAEGLAQIRQSANDAIQQMCGVTGTYKRRVLFTLRQGAIFYRIQSRDDYILYVVQAIDRSRRYRLVQTTPARLSSEDLAWLKRAGEPTHYMQICHDVIGFWRKPTITGKVIEADCVMIPKEYEHGDQAIRLRKNFQEACVYFAVGEYYASRGDANRAKEWMNRYLQAADLMRLTPTIPGAQYQMTGGGSAISSQAARTTGAGR